MTQPPNPTTQPAPLVAPIAALNQPQPQVPAPAAVPAPIVAPAVAQQPYAVLVKGPDQIEHPLPVIRAVLKLTRNGNAPALGFIELEARVHNRTDVASLLTVATMVGQYTITLRYFAPDGSVVRNDNITVNATSRAVYSGPQLEQDSESWSFIEKLTIHA